MELTLLSVQGCPNVAVFAERLEVALAGFPGVVVDRREVADEEAAVRAGMCGSPALLVDGADPFAVPGQEPSLSCRIYRDADGRPVPAPSAGELRRVLLAAASRPGASRRD